MEAAPVNPLHQYRIDNFLSIDDLSADIGISASTLIRTEQGCYNDIPPTIARFLSLSSSSNGSQQYFTPDTVRSMYHRFQRSQRTRNCNTRLVRGYQRTLLERYRKSRKTKNPFIIFRELQGYKSRLAFCKDFCLHPSTVKRLEDGLANRIPESVISALSAGETMTGDDIEFLENIYRDYLERNR